MSRPDARQVPARKIKGWARRQNGTTTCRSIAMELGDVQVAVDLAPRIDASTLPTERRVRHAIETARAYTARNRGDDALRVMLEAEQLAPEQIRHHAISRQLVLSWLRTTRGPRSVALEQLAGRLHLA